MFLFVLLCFLIPVSDSGGIWCLSSVRESSPIGKLKTSKFRSELSLESCLLELCHAS